AGKVYPPGPTFGRYRSGNHPVKIRPSKRYTLDNLNRIDQIDQYNPFFPEARKLSPENILLIKTALERFRKYPNAAHKEAIQLLVEEIKHKPGIQPGGIAEVDFLKALIKDYVVLTR
ncbi:MAG: hypothetical protein HC880_18945, partial [Bacteroidia bacterium]|nr:hypothetical protein [Bacteroidia bacterium]